MLLEIMLKSPHFKNPLTVSIEIKDKAQIPQILTHLEKILIPCLDFEDYLAWLKEEKKEGY